MISMSTIRSKSWRYVASLGLSTNNALPLLDNCSVKKSVSDIVLRSFGMLCLAAVAYGFNRSRALAWLEREGGTSLLAKDEAKYLMNNCTDSYQYKIQIEGLWALCWCINKVNTLDPAKQCDDTFIGIFPNLKSNEDGRLFFETASLRSEVEIAEMCDKYYCIHWSMINEERKLNNNKTIVSKVIVEERRKALEWVLSAESWSDISLDT